jgi:WXG100 family type VII secretion target
MTAYSVDLDELDALVARMARFDAALAEHMAKLDARIVRLHRTWTGDAAIAQKAEHDKWMQAARDMRQAMAVMRSAGRTAHANYTRALAANASMWNGV